MIERCLLLGFGLSSADSHSRYHRQCHNRAVLGMDQYAQRQRERSQSGARSSSRQSRVGAEHWRGYGWQTTRTPVWKTLAKMFWLKLRMGFGKPPEDGEDRQRFKKRMNEFERRLSELTEFASAMHDDSEHQEDRHES